MVEGTQTGPRSQALDKLKDAITEIVQAGAAHHEAGRLQEAEAVYRKVLEVDPNQPDALNLLGVIALQVGNPAMAVELIGKAVTARPNIADMYNNLGAAHQALGQMEKSIACFTKALDIAPGNATATTTSAVPSCSKAKWPRPRRASGRQPKSCPSTRLRGSISATP
ncbi:MAG: tetratricopeptide repeat protein [Rhodospirillales bacterium]|nr:tetratricopeptide repeat protein [Rhodospirillales bacterium]